jgi:hypothetical protein
MQSPTIIFLSLCFLLAFSSSVPETPYPLLVASSENLEDLSSVLFTDHNELINATFDKFQQKSGTPTKTLLYVVSTPYQALETLNFVSQNRNKYPNLMDLLKNKKKSYSSKYVQYTASAFQETITSKINLTVHEHPFTDQIVHQNLLKSSTPSFEAIHFDLSNLKDLNIMLYQDLQALSKLSPESYAIFILFNHQAHPRVLQDETATIETTVPDNGETSTVTEFTSTDSTTTAATNASNTTTNSTMTLRIQPYVMTGYLFTLLALFIVLVGGIALCSVQAPDKFPRLPLLVGRESN